MLTKKIITEQIDVLIAIPSHLPLTREVLLEKVNALTKFCEKLGSLVESNWLKTTMLSTLQEIQQSISGSTSASVLNSTQLKAQQGEWHAALVSVLTVLSQYIMDDHHYYDERDHNKRAQKKARYDQCKQEVCDYLQQSDALSDLVPSVWIDQFLVNELKVFSKQFDILEQLSGPSPELESGLDEEEQQESAEARAKKIWCIEGYRAPALYLNKKMFLAYFHALFFEPHDDRRMEYIKTLQDEQVWETIQNWFKSYPYKGSSQDIMNIDDLARRSPGSVHTYQEKIDIDQAFAKITTLIPYLRKLAFLQKNRIRQTEIGMDQITSQQCNDEVEHNNFVNQIIAETSTSQETAFIALRSQATSLCSQRKSAVINRAFHLKGHDGCEMVQSHVNHCTTTIVTKIPDAISNHQERIEEKAKKDQCPSSLEKFLLTAEKNRKSNKEPSIQQNQDSDFFESILRNALSMLQAHVRQHSGTSLEDRMKIIITHSSSVHMRDAIIVFAQLFNVDVLDRTNGMDSCLSKSGIIQQDILNKYREHIATFIERHGSNELKALYQEACDYTLLHHDASSSKENGLLNCKKIFLTRTPPCQSLQLQPSRAQENEAVKKAIGSGIFGKVSSFFNRSQTTNNDEGTELEPLNHASSITSLDSTTF